MTWLLRKNNSVFFFFSKILFSGIEGHLRYEIAGKYMPMAISRRRKARKETTVSMLEAPGRVVKQQIAIVVAIISRQFWRWW